MSQSFSATATYQPVSLFQLFSVGIGPSSSHTVGPMRAAKLFAEQLEEKGLFTLLESLRIELYGSLAMTGKGHATDTAIILGLEGYSPEKIDPDLVPHIVQRVARENVLRILGKEFLPFDSSQDLLFLKGKRLPYHSNAMKLQALDARGEVLLSCIFYSVGGGFVVEHSTLLAKDLKAQLPMPPFPFRTSSELLEHCRQSGKRIDEIIMENEKTWRNEDKIRQGILSLWQVMKNCVKRGCEQEGILPGGLNVKRRARDILMTLSSEKDTLLDPSEIFDWVSLFALAVNEENAAGGRVVTAPTNGAAGVIPAVLHYYEKFCPTFSEEGVIRFFLAACAVGLLFKEGASLSAAEMGCQGEVGVACSMAAAGLTAALAGTNEQVENAAEIGMEHNLGLTCDPVAGLVQIPCIERNTMGAVQAINAARLALKGDGCHRVSLDDVIKTMRQTGEDMMSIYKETSEGGLALHVSVSHPEC